MTSVNLDIATPSIVLLSAAPASGKTTFIKYLLYTLMRAGRRDAGLVFTNSFFNGEYSYLPAKAVSVYNEEKLKKLMRFQRDGVLKGNPKHVFLVLDDCLGSINFQSQLWSLIISQYRHYKITLFISTQRIYKVSPLIRECASYAIVFAPKEGSTIDALHDTYGFEMKKEEFKKMLLANTKNYHCVIINNFARGNDPRIICMKAPEIGNFKITFKK